MKNVRTIEELEKVLENEKAQIELDFICRVLHGLELGSNFLSGTEQGDLLEELSTDVYDLVNEHINDEEFIIIEENNLLKENI